VREGEVKATQQNASMLERLGVSAERVLSGQQLTPDQRAKILQAAEQQYNGVLKSHDTYKSQFKDLLDKRGIAPEDVFLNFGQGPAPKAQEKIISQDPIAAPPDGAIQIKGSDGNLYWGDPKTKTVFGRVK
jgi:hypothetical protein